MSDWIECAKRLPEEPEEYLVSWMPLNPEERAKRNGVCFIEMIEFDVDPEDPDDEGEWIIDIPQAIHYGGAEIIAWMPTPEQYVIEEEKDE